MKEWDEKRDCIVVWSENDNVKCEKMLLVCAFADIGHEIEI